MPFPIMILTPPLHQELIYSCKQAALEGYPFYSVLRLKGGEEVFSVATEEQEFKLSTSHCHHITDVF